MRKTGRCILSAVIAVLLMIGAIDYASVSYTHLTLPTICSV